MRNLLLLPLFFAATAFAGPYKTGNTFCDGFPRVESLKTPDGMCVGLVGDAGTVGWKGPRKVLAHQGDLFVSAFGGWKKNVGQVWRLSARFGKMKSQMIFQGTDRTHGLRLGPDGRIYFGDATRILRFDPNASRPQAEVVINGLPDKYTLPDGKVVESNHPLTEFIFLPEGHIVANVGAPSNDCSEEFKLSKSCAQRDVQANLRLYYYNPQTNSFDPNFTVIAKGLRNSMGLLFNAQTDELYQAENAADREGTPDEINVIDFNRLSQGKAYDFGWPYCFANGLRYTGYENFKTFCAQKADRPFILLPPHAAPLDMLRYEHSLLPGLQGKVLISWHGHRPSGSRLAVYDTNSAGQLLTAKPWHLIDGWQEDGKRRHPKGRPVGMAMDERGVLYVVDDANESLLIVSTTEEIVAPPSEEDQAPVITENDLYKIYPQARLIEWDRMFDGLVVSKNCQSCHSDVVDNSSPRRTLAEMINRHWIRVDGAQREEQTLWKRMTGDGVRIMPPPPASTIIDDKDRRNSTYKELEYWLN